MPEEIAVPEIEESSFASDPAEDTSETDIADAVVSDDFVRSAKVEIKGKEVEITWDVSEMTPRLRRKLASLSDGDGSEDVLVEYLSTIVTGWNLTDKHGNSMSLADMDNVSYRDLGKISEVITKSLSPNA